MWIILADAAGVGTALAARLGERGGRCVIARRSGVGDDLYADYRIDPIDPVAFDPMVQSAAGAANARWRGCIYLWSLDAPSLDAITADSIEAAWLPASVAGLHLVQALSRCQAAAPTWFVTSHAVAVGTGDRPAGAVQSPLWGLGRVVGLEHPELWGGLIDVDASDVQTMARRIAAEVTTGDGEDQIAFRGDRRLVARLARTGRVAAASVPVRSDGSYLVTGASGRIGLEVARWLAAHGARHLTLVSRSGFPGRESSLHPPREDVDRHRLAALAGIEAMGAAVTVVAADVSDAVQMRDVFAAFGRSVPPLRGVVHAAAHTGTARVDVLTADGLRAMLRPKVTGALVLQQLAGTLPLDFFVLFSSTTGLLGSVAMGHYAAANVFLDAFAHARRSATFPITSVAWGAWEGLDVGSDEMRRAFDRGGLKPMPVAAGLEAFGRLLCPAAPHVMVIDANWAMLKSAYESQRIRPLLAEIAGTADAVPRPARAAATSRGDALRKIEAAVESERREVVIDHVLREAAGVLRISADDLDPGQGLFDLGMDSLMSVELKGKLERSFDRKLPTTLTFNYPSVLAIAGFIAGELGLGEAGAPANRAGGDRHATTTGDAASAPLDLDDLSESELAALLTGKLASL